MAEVDLTYVVRAQDRTRAVFQQVTQSVKAMNATVTEAGRTSQRSFAGMAASATMASRSVQLLHTSSRSLSLSMRNLHAPLMGVVRGVGSLGAGVLHAAGAVANRLNQALQTLGRLLAGTALAGTAAATAALIAFAKAGVSMNVTLDGAQAALSRMTGSSRNAVQLLGGLRQEAMASSLTFKEMLPIAQSLVGVLGAGGLGQVIPIMRAFGDTAAALQVSRGGLQNALLGFRQMLGKPLVQQEEVNQINESLPGANISGILTRAFGTSDTEVLQKAGVTGQQAGAAIIRGLQQAFGGSQAAAAGSIPMLFSAIQDSVNDLSGIVSRDLTRSIQRAMAAFSGFLNNIQRSRVGTAALKILKQVLDGVGAGFETLISSVPRLLAAFVSMAQAPGLTQFSRTVLRIFSDIQDKSGDAFTMIARAWDKLWGGAADLLEFSRRLFVAILAGLGASVRGMGIQWAEVWGRMAGWTKNAVKIIGGSIAGVVGVFEDLGKVQRDGQTGFQKLGESIKSWAIGTIQAVASVGIAVLGLVGVYGALIGTIAALTRNATLGLEAGKALAISFGGAFAILFGAAALKKGVQGINFDSGAQAATGINVGQSYRSRRDQFTGAFEDAFQASGQPALPGMPARRPQAGPGPDFPAAPRLRGSRITAQYRQPAIAGGVSPPGYSAEEALDVARARAEAQTGSLEKLAAAQVKLKMLLPAILARQQELQRLALQLQAHGGVPGKGEKSRAELETEYYKLQAEAQDLQRDATPSTDTRRQQGMLRQLEELRYAQERLQQRAADVRGGRGSLRSRQRAWQGLEYQYAKNQRRMALIQQELGGDVVGGAGVGSGAGGISSGISGGGGGVEAGGGISLPINIVQFDLTDPRFRARLHQLIDERLDFVTRRAGLRGAF